MNSSRKPLGASDLSASSSVTSLLRGGTGLSRRADAGDLLLDVEEDEEKFFWDFVREPLSSDTSSLAVAFRMLLSHRKEGLVDFTVNLRGTRSRRTHLKDGFWLELLGVSGLSEWLLCKMVVTVLPTAPLLLLGKQEANKRIKCQNLLGSSRHCSCFHTHSSRITNWSDRLFLDFIEEKVSVCGWNSSRRYHPPPSAGWKC